MQSQSHLYTTNAQFEQTTRAPIFTLDFDFSLTAMAVHLTRLYQLDRDALFRLLGDVISFPECGRPYSPTTTAIHGWTCEKSQ